MMSACLLMCERKYTLKLLKFFPVVIFGTSHALHLFCLSSDRWMRALVIRNTEPLGNTFVLKSGWLMYIVFYL